MKRFIVAALTLPVFLVGCGGTPTDNRPTPERNHVFNIQVDGDTDKAIFEFTTPEGMPCLTNYEGALTCDWDYNEEVSNGFE